MLPTEAQGVSKKYKQPARAHAACSSSSSRFGSGGALTSGPDGNEDGTGDGEAGRDAENEFWDRARRAYGLAGAMGAERDVVRYANTMQPEPCVSLP